MLFSLLLPIKRQFPWICINLILRQNKFNSGITLASNLFKRQDTWLCNEWAKLLIYLAGKSWEYKVFFVTMQNSRTIYRSLVNNNKRAFHYSLSHDASYYVDKCPQLSFMKMVKEQTMAVGRFTWSTVDQTISFTQNSSTSGALQNWNDYVLLRSSYFHYCTVLQRNNLSLCFVIQDWLMIVLVHTLLQKNNRMQQTEILL